MLYENLAGVSVQGVVGGYSNAELRRMLRWKFWGSAARVEFLAAWKTLNKIIVVSTYTV